MKGPFLFQHDHATSIDTFIFQFYIEEHDLPAQSSDLNLILNLMNGDWKPGLFA